MNKYTISRWEPEAPAFWRSDGRATAQRNLWLSIPALLLSFAVWMVWSVVVLRLPDIGFRYSTNQLFWLTALPGLSGATLRIFYALMVPLFGGRKWTAISTASLLIPALGIGSAVQDPTTSYPTMLMLALLCGFGGGNFASSMANIALFFPNRQKEHALDLNAGLGFLGVAAVQLIVPLAISGALFGAAGGEAQAWLKEGEIGRLWLQNAGFVWVPPILMATVAAWFGMNDLAAGNGSFSEQAVIFKRKHNWLMCWLHLGTFGSFIGYAAGFPLLLKTQFAEMPGLQYAFLGPLAGALARIVGGRIADRLGAAAVSLWTFVAMIGAVAGVLYFLPGWRSGGNFTGFFLMFIVLFAATGIGSASTSRMIAAIFITERLRAVAGKGMPAYQQAVTDANTEATAALVFTSAAAACGAFFIPKSYGTAIAFSGSPGPALWCFIAFYISCCAITWWCYLRKGAGMRC